MVLDQHIGFLSLIALIEIALSFDHTGLDDSVSGPVTMLLLGSGLVGLAALGRKKLFK